MQALADPDCGWFYRADARDFKAIPGSPIAYWASSAVRNAFIGMPTVKDETRLHVGVQTGDNERFLRLWWEVESCNSYFDCPDVAHSKQDSRRWYPCNKGGEFRRWYGNQDYLINWQNDGRIIVGDAEMDARRFMNLPAEFKFCETVAWSMLSSSRAAFRYFPEGFIFEHASSATIGAHGALVRVLAFCNSEVARILLEMVSPTLNFNLNCIAQLPMPIRVGEEVENLAQENIEIAMCDWNICETSWSFDRHPLL